MYKCRILECINYQYTCVCIYVKLPTLNLNFCVTKISFFVFYNAYDIDVCKYLIMYNVKYLSVCTVLF